MLLQLENTIRENINRLLDFAKDHSLKLALVYDEDENHYLLGKPLSNGELSSLIKKSRESGTVTIQEAHDILRKTFNAN